MTFPRIPAAPRTVAAVAAAALALAACSGGSSGGGDAAGTPAPVDTAAKVTLTWWTGQTEDAQDTLEALAAEFSGLHPNVTIEASSGAPTTDDLLQKLTAGFAGDSYPDISYTYGSWAGELAASGKTLDITDQVSDPAVGWDQFPPAARDTASPGGVTIGFPALVDNLAVFYNPELFAGAGVPEPTPDWTWDDFRAAAKAITDESKTIYGTAYSVSGSEDTTWHLWPLLWQRGGEVLNPDGTTSAFNSEAGVGALEFLRAMAVDDKSMYLDQTDEKYAQLFMDGRIGMIITGPWQLYDLREQDASYKVVQLPGTNGNHTTVSGPDIWAMFDHDDPNRAYWSVELMKWLTSKEVDVRWNLAVGNLPLRAEAAQTPEFTQYVADFPGADTLFANMANATKPRPTVPAYVDLSTAVGEAIATVLQGAAQPKEALDEAAEVADLALAEG